MSFHSLPLRRHLSIPSTLTIAVGILAALASIAGLVFQTTLYPFEELRYSSVATDVVNLIIVLPVLFGAFRFARRGSLTGLLFWPGALLIFTYHYLAYSLQALSAWQTSVYLLITVLSAAAIYQLLGSIEMASVQERLEGRVPARMAAAVLAGFGLLFFFWRGSLVLQSLAGSADLSGPELATAITDVIFCPAWVIVGVLLWRGKSIGYVGGAGLLFQFSMLFIGLFVYFALQPVLAGVPFPVDDFVAVFVMSLVCFVPFALFTRGILRSANR